MSDPTIGFRCLERRDLPLLHTWLNRDFVLQWYSRRPQTYAEVVAKYGPRIDGHAPTRCFLIRAGERAIGYIQTYAISDYPDYSAYVQVEEGAAGVDLFIGEADYIHRGLGSAILTGFLREVIFGTTDATCCVLGPEPQNKVAIRAYEKAGFRYLKTIQLPDEPEPEYLMRIERGDVLQSSGADHAL